MNYKNNIFISALSNYDLWSYMAQTKIRIRFFRTILGPIWEIIGTLIFIIFISLELSNPSNFLINKFNNEILLNLIILT